MGAVILLKTLGPGLASGGEGAYKAVMKKLLVIGGGGLLAIVLLLGIGGWAFLNFYLDPLLKSAVEDYGPRYTGTPVTVDKVNLSLLSKEGSIEKFFIGNPEIFTEDETLFRVDQVELAVDPWSLTGDVVRIHKLTIKNPYITFLEVKDPETRQTLNNFTVVQENVEKASGGAQAPSETGPGETEQEAPAPAEPAPEQRIIMDVFVLEGARVKVKTPLMPEAAEITVPRLEMKNVGGETGVTPDEFTEMITEAIMADVVVQIIDQIPGQVIAGIGQLADTLGSEVGDKAMAAYGKIEDLTGAALDRATEALGEAGALLEEGTGRVNEALGRLPGFGRGGSNEDEE
ncbi:MAG: hypothetical protein ACFB20_12780 [Opitutales bacterium]